MSARMRRLVIFVVATAALALVAGLAWWRYAPDRLVWRTDTQRGDAVVQQIEAFRKAHDRLPTGIGELSLSEAERDHFFYQACDKDRYVVWFGTTLGWSMAYDSTRKTWDSYNRCPDGPGGGDGH